MKSGLIVVALLVSAPLLTFARCPNACSGHGSCGDFDSCICQSNWEGGDCSKRVCMYNWAWVTTAQGDLNFDGDLNDGTQYNDNFDIVTGGVYLTTDAAPGGTWETWPEYHSSATNEGHFYMECSNRGLCDRKTGECQCFEGYTGVACRRTECANGCSGHGVCLSVAEQTSDDNDLTGGSLSYALWDKDMSRTCVCDAGYTGPSCAERFCPLGDDPLTKTHQVNEIQWVEIRSENTAGADLGGTFTASFTDSYGKVWTTDPVDVMHMEGRNAHQVATDLENALEAIPNDAITDVSVTAQYCEKILPNHFVDFDGTAGTNTYGTNPGSGALRCPAEVQGGLLAGDIITNAAGTSILINGWVGEGNSVYDETVVGAYSPTGGVQGPCNHLVYHECIRLQVEFSANPGAVTDLTIDHSLVTIDLGSGSITNAQDSNGNLNSVVTDDLTLVDDAAATFGFTQTSTMVNTAGDTSGRIDPANGIDLGNSPSDTTMVFTAGNKIELFCTTGSVKRSLGIYTVSSTFTVTADTWISVDEAIVNDNGPCLSAGLGTVEIQLISHVVDTNVDFRQYSIGNKVPKITTFSEEPETNIDSVTYDVSTGTGQIYLDGVSSLVTSVTSAALDLSINGVGTKENVECGDRGLCNRDTGVCKCFKGYAGDACGVQNSLAA